MASSAKRYGLDIKQNLELELRLRGIETELAKLARVVDFGGEDTSDVTQSTTTVPQVTGLRVLGKIPGAITLAWNQVRISDLRRYELDVATDLAFSTDKQTFNVAGTEYQFSTISLTGGGGTAIYARVRARNRASIPGPYSVVLNATIGQVQTVDIADGAITTDKVSSDDPISFDGLDESDVGAKLALRGYINGLILSNNTDDAVNDIDISAGIARDTTNTVSMRLTSTFTKRIDDDWTIGTGNGGFPSTLTLAINTWYFVFLLSNSDGSSIDAGFDTSTTAANLLADSGFTLYRRLGAIRTNGSSEIYAFKQIGNDFFWDVPKQDVSLNNPGTGEVTHTLDFVPAGYEIFANITIVFHNQSSPGSPTNFLYLYGGGNTTLAAASSSNCDVSAIGDQRSGFVHDRVLTNTSAQVKTRQDHGDTNYYVFIQVHGWVEVREENTV